MHSVRRPNPRPVHRVRRPPQGGGLFASVSIVTSLLAVTLLCLGASRPHAVPHHAAQVTTLSPAPAATHITTPQLSTSAAKPTGSRPTRASVSQPIEDDSANADPVVDVELELGRFEGY